jgi:hypothetical protein
MTGRVGCQQVGSKAHNYCDHQLRAGKPVDKILYIRKPDLHLLLLRQSNAFCRFWFNAIIS